MAVVKLYEKDIPVRDFMCSLNGEKPTPVTTPYVNLYVRMTNCCLSNCSFCIYHQKVDSPFSVTDKFERWRFVDVLNVLKSKVHVNKVNFTGGEPLLKLSDLQYAIEEVRKRFPKVYITVNTNGQFIEELEHIIGSVDCIAISRHHYDPIINAVLFDFKDTKDWVALDKYFIKSKLDKSKIHYRCNLIKGSIDNAQKIALYLDEMSKYGVTDYGFVSLMKLNTYCKNNFVPPIDIASIPDTLMTKEWKKGNTCRCQNYIHLTKSGRMVTIYDRVDDCPGDDTGTLVFNVDYLRQGFDGDMIDERFF